MGTTDRDAPEIDARAWVEPGARIGARSRLAAFAHVQASAVVGCDCRVGDAVFIADNVSIGDRVVMDAGVHVCENVRIEDEVIAAANVTFAQDVLPLDRARRKPPEPTHVRQGASLGANSTVQAGVTIGQYAMVAAGAVVTKSVPPYAVVSGNPAAIHGYVTDAAPSHPIAPAPTAKGESRLSVRGVELLEFPRIRDLRGELSFAEVGNQLPFAPKRIFWVFGVPSREIRGEHAHRALHQLLICVSGTVSVMVDDGSARDTVVLDEPNKALHVPPMVWASQFHYSPDATLVVLASEVYDAGDYIRDYEDFLVAVKARR